MRNKYSRYINGTILLVSLMAMLLADAYTDRVTGETEKKATLPALNTSGLETVYQDNGRELALDSSSGEFVYTDKGIGRSLYSNPVNRLDDSIATGYHKLNMDSQLMIRYANEKRVILDQNTAVGCVKKGGLKAYGIDKGFRLEFEFISEKIMIPVEVTVGENGLDVRVILDQIEENGTSSLVDFALLPYLGSAGMTDEGYLVIPEGSGALVRFTKDKELVAEGLYYKKDIYGKDLAYDTKAIESASQDIMLPVFGINTQDGGMLGIITQGDAISALEIFSEGVQSENTVVHPYVTFRPIDSVTIHKGQWNEKNVTLISTVKAGGFDYEVRYMPMAADSCDYNAMAKAAAAYYGTLFAESRNVVKTPVMMVRVPMAVRKPGSFAGIPVNLPYAITTAGQISLINAMIHESIQDPVGMILDGAFKGGMFDRIPTKAKLEPVIGKISDMELNAADVLFLSTDLVRIYSSGNGIRYRADASRSISGGFNERYNYLKSTFQKNEEGLSWTILRPLRVLEVYAKFTGRLSRSGIPSLEDLGIAQLSSDNHRTFGAKKSGSNRETVKRIHMDAAASLSAGLENYTVMFAPTYLLGSATQTTDVPASSGNWSGFSGSIPFYQLVVSPFAPIYGVPVNYLQDRDQYMFRSIEYGMLPQVALTGSETYLLQDTAARDIFNGYYKDWTKEIASWSTEYAAAWKIMQNAYLTAHEKTGEFMAKSTFSDGSVITLDYSKMEMTVTGGDKG